MSATKTFQHFRIGEAEYRFSHLNAAEEFHCARRIGGVVATTGSLMTALAAQGSGDDVEGDRIAGIVEGASPLLQAFSALSEADTDYVMARCLGATEIRQGDAWVPVWDADAGVPALLDLRMTAILRTCYEVLREAITVFFSDAASNLVAIGFLRPATAP